MSRAVEKEIVACVSPITGTAENCLPATLTAMQKEATTGQ